MRGDFGEGNPWQYPMGQATQPVLEAMGVICLRSEQPDDVLAAVAAALTMVFQAGRPWPCCSPSGCSAPSRFEGSAMPPAA